MGTPYPCGPPWLAGTLHSVKEGPILSSNAGAAERHTGPRGAAVLHTLIWPPCFHFSQVEQSYALIPMEQQFAAIYNVLRRHAEETPDHKVRVL